MLKQHQTNVLTLNHRRINVVITLCACLGRDVQDRKQQMLSYLLNKIVGNLQNVSFPLMPTRGMFS